MTIEFLHPTGLEVRAFGKADLFDWSPSVSTRRLPGPGARCLCPYCQERPAIGLQARDRSLQVRRRGPNADDATVREGHGTVMAPA
jgi:hypothetical protein